MGVIICPECGKETNDSASSCTYCGYPISISEIPKVEAKTMDVSEQSDSVADTMNGIKQGEVICKKLRSIRNWLATFAICAFVVAGFFFYKGYDVKTNYYNSEYSSLNENAYVGGDAYNYIINGTYFTAYSVLGAAFLLGGFIMCGSAFNVYVRVCENEE